MMPKMQERRARLSHSVVSNGMRSFRGFKTLAGFGFCESTAAAEAAVPTNIHATWHVTVLPASMTRFLPECTLPTTISHFLHPTQTTQASRRGRNSCCCAGGRRTFRNCGGIFLREFACFLGCCFGIKCFLAREGHQSRQFDSCDVLIAWLSFWIFPNVNS